MVAVSIMPVLVWDLLTSMRKEFLWFILCPVLGVDQVMSLVTQQTAKREIVSPKSDPKMDRLAVVLRQATIMARDLILLLNHSVK